MSEAAPQINRLPKYRFEENPHLTQSACVRDIDMDDYSVSRNDTPLYTSGCAVCGALIVVTRMDNGEMWHGLYHSSMISNKNEVHKHFTHMEDDIEKITGHHIVGADYYIVINPQYKDEYSLRLKELGIVLNILIPKYDCRQLSVDDDDSVENDQLIGSVDVKLSDGLIEVKFIKPIRS